MVIHGLELAGYSSTARRLQDSAQAFGIGRSAIFDRQHAADISRTVSRRLRSTDRLAFIPSVQTRSFGTPFGFRLDSRRYQRPRPPFLVTPRTPQSQITNHAFPALPMLPALNFASGRIWWNITRPWKQ
jgi:hypothetical protein